MSRLAVGQLEGLASEGYRITVASGSRLVQAGSILQFVYSQTTSTFTTSSGSWVDWTNMTATITPRESNSLIMVMVNAPRYQYVSGVAQPIYLRLLRGGTLIALETQNYVNTNNSQVTGQTGFTWIDNPATTSATTYKVQTTAGVSQSFSWVWGSIILMEVAQ